MKDDRKEIGRMAEDAVCSHLMTKGYELLARNFRKPEGEIDIIARKGARIHFLEIKSVRLGVDTPVKGSWDSKQMERFIRLSEVYIAENSEMLGTDYEVSLDFVAVEMGPDGEVLSIEHIEDAIRPD